jgi:aminobenzoyl-glutamate transport protein
MKENKGIIQKMMMGIERVGNKLPDPVTLFVILAGLVLVISWIASQLGLSATRPGTIETVEAVNLLSSEGLHRIFTQMVKVFTDFPPLGIVLVVMIGIGVAERTGLISAVLKGFVSVIPGQLVTFALITAGMLSSLAADAGYVVLVPLGAVIFYGMGRHPLAGLAAAFAGVSGGFSANLVLTSLDPLLAGFTKSAVDLVPGMEEYPVFPTANYYLMITLVPVFALVGTFVNSRIIEPMLGEYTEKADISNDQHPLTRDEKKGLIWSFIGFMITCALFSLMVIPEDGVLRGEDGSLAPFYQSIVAIMLFVFFIPGLIYGMATKAIKNDKDVAKMTSETMATMGAYIVLAFAAAQFVAYFNWSNLGIILAIGGADFLQNVGLSGIPLIIFFYYFCRLKSFYWQCFG